MRIKRIISAILCAAVCVSVSACKKDDNTDVPEETQAPSESETVTYSGVLRPVREVKVYADKTGQINECAASVGDMVTEGQILYRLDDDGIYDSIKTARNSVEKSQINLSTAQKNVDDLKVYAPVSGILKDFTIKAGERVNTQTLGKLVDESQYVARVPFTSGQLASISVGSAAQVVCDDMMSAMSGKVTRIYSERNTSVAGADLYDVEITGRNSGGIPEGMTVSAVINGIESPTAGYIDESSSEALVSRGSGNARAVYYKEGDYVKKGALVVDIENANTTAALERAKIDVQDSQTRLNSLLDDEKKLTIYAPMSGMVTERKKEERDTIGSKSDSIMTISDISSMVMETTVSDEEAFAALYDGMTVSVSCREYGTAAGTVSEIDQSDKSVKITVVNTIGITPETVGAVSVCGGVWNV